MDERGWAKQLAGEATGGGGRGRAQTAPSHAILGRGRAAALRGNGSSVVYRNSAHHS